MACFSDLWRCTDHGGPYTDPGCGQGRCQARRGLCAIPPRRWISVKCIHMLYMYNIIKCQCVCLLFMSRQEPLSPQCPATADWPATSPGTVSHRPCPQGQQGEVSRGQSGLHIIILPLCPHSSGCVALWLLGPEGHTHSWLQQLLWDHWLPGDSQQTQGIQEQCMRRCIDNRAICLRLEFFKGKGSSLSRSSNTDKKCCFESNQSMLT